MDPYHSLTTDHNVNYSMPQQGGDFHAIAHQNVMMMNPHVGQNTLMGLPPVSSSFSSEDSGRKRSREREVLDSAENSDSDHLEESYVEDDDNVNLQQLYLHAGELQPIPGQRLTGVPQIDDVALQTPKLNISPYPMKFHKIGTSRPRKKQSPSPASSKAAPGVDSGGSTTRKKSGMTLVERVWHGIYEGTKLAKQFRGGIGLDVCHTPFHDIGQIYLYHHSCPKTVQAARSVSVQLRNVQTQSPVSQQVC